MRVPIYPEDLDRAQGFKRIAKQVQKKWPGTPAINLSLARELLSKGFGYNDYHDLLESSKTCLPDTPAPLNAEVLAGVSRALLAAQATHGLSVDAIDLQAVVDALPLHALSAFNPQNHAQSNFAPAHHVVPPVKNAVADREAPRLPTPVVTAKTKSNRLGRTIKLISQDQLRELHEFVHRTGSLRDQCLLTMLQLGFRPHEIVSAKAEPDDHHEIVFRAKTKADKTRIAIDHTGTLQRYTQANKLGPGDYLFPCTEDPTRPMTSKQFMKIFSSWLVQLNFEKFTPYQLRMAYIIRLMETRRLDSIDTIRASVGHSSPINTMHDVVSSLRTKDR